MSQRRGPGGVRTPQQDANLIEKEMHPEDGWYCRRCHKGPQFEEPCNNCGADMHGRPTGQNP